jgi:hypothetical protein
MATNKETLELLRAGSVLTAKVLSASDNGVGAVEIVRAVVSSAGYLYEGIVGISQIPDELADLDENEVEQIIDEVINLLRKTGRFTAREREVADRIMQLVHHIVRELLALKNLPPSALPVP